MQLTPLFCVFLESTHTYWRYCQLLWVRQAVIDRETNILKCILFLSDKPVLNQALTDTAFFVQFPQVK